MGYRVHGRHTYQAEKPEEWLLDHRFNHYLGKSGCEEPSCPVEAGRLAFVTFDGPVWFGDEGLITEEKGLARRERQLQQDRLDADAARMVDMRTMWLGHAGPSDERGRRQGHHLQEHEVVRVA